MPSQTVLKLPFSLLKVYIADNSGGLTFKALTTSLPRYLSRNTHFLPAVFRGILRRVIHRRLRIRRAQVQKKSVVRVLVVQSSKMLHRPFFFSFRHLTTCGVVLSKKYPNLPVGNRIKTLCPVELRRLGYFRLCFLSLGIL